MASKQEVPLVLVWGGGPRERELVVSVAPGEQARGGWEAWPDPVPEHALLLLWPRTFPWSAASSRFAGTLRRRGGVMHPLVTVLRRVGVQPGRGWAGLTKSLLPEWGEVDDPVEAARAMGDVVADLLARTDGEPTSGDDGDAEDVLSVAPAVRVALSELPASPGVYFLRDGSGDLLYVGKAASLRERVPQHFRRGAPEEAKRRRLAATREMFWEETGSELEALLLEHRSILAHHPLVNTQVTVQKRPRGRWRRAETLAVLPSARKKHVEVCLVGGDGRFHWQRVPRRARLPRSLAARIRSFLTGALPGWAPAEPGLTLDTAEQAVLAEIALSWFTRQGDGVSRIDLRGETPGRVLWDRLRRLLVEDPRGGRVVVP
jgi:hypothetical protein